jgi:hypothetical protein
MAFTLFPLFMNPLGGAGSGPGRIVTGDLEIDLIAPLNVTVDDGSVQVTIESDIQIDIEDV